MDRKEPRTTPIRRRDYKLYAQSHQVGRGISAASIADNEIDSWEREEFLKSEEVWKFYTIAVMGMLAGLILFIVLVLYGYQMSR